MKSWLGTIGFTLGYSLLIAAPITLAEPEPNDSAEASRRLKPSLPLNELRTFADVFDQIKNAYVEEVSDQELLENAIIGMLNNLDPHSDYLKPEAFEDLQVNTTGEFGGLGIEVTVKDGYIKVVAPMDDTPAAKGGIQPGDLIIMIDGESTRDLGLTEAVEKMRGKAGTAITLKIAREGTDEPFDLELTRAVIQVASVKQRELEPGFGYLRISHFQVDTGEDAKKALRKLIDSSEKPLQGLVLDLRNNPGGVLQAGVAVSDLFLDEGLVVYTQGRLTTSDLKFNAKPGQILPDTPIVVLVNSGTASASEIVAGALQDHQRAIIMGTTTFGKGSVQTVLPLHNQRALKLTTARYFTPEGRSIQASGIVPDIVVGHAKVSEIADTMQQSEASLRGHLEQSSDNEKRSKKDAKKASTTKKSDEPPLITRDYQLYQALTLLKGLNIVRR